MMATNKAMEDVQMGTKRPSIDMESLKCKKFKADDLPISAAQHAAIDKLLHSFKKKGGFDSIRKQIWAEFNDGDSKTNFTNQLITLAESEIEREPAHLSRERGKAATLIEGAVDRSDVYKNVEDSIDQLASKHLQNILNSVRAIRREEIGEEAASKEDFAGSKTDEDYEAFVRAKRDEREKIWREEMRKQKELEDEQKRIKEEEKRKKRELERQKEEEERARRKEIDDKRRAERERIREEQRAFDERRDREREERYERRRREDRDRYRDRYRDRSPAYRSDRGLSPRSRDPKQEKSTASKDPTPAPLLPAVDEKSLEEAALQMLLKEGEELAAKARQKREFDFEEAEAIENGLKPPSTSAPAKNSTTSTRAHKIEAAAAASLIDDTRLGMTLIVVAIVPGMLLSDLETVIWRNAGATVISVISAKNAAIDPSGAAVAGQLSEEDETVIASASVKETAALTGIETDFAIETGTVTVTVTMIESDPDRATEIMTGGALIEAAIEVEIGIVLVVTIIVLAELDTLGLLPADAQARDLATEIAVGSAIVHVHDLLLLDDAPVPSRTHDEVGHLDVEFDHRNETETETERGVRSTDTSPVPNGQRNYERRARKARLNPWLRLRLLKIQMTAGFVAAVAVVEEAEVEADEEALVGVGVAAAEGAEVGRSYKS
ncbi:Arginine rich protein [Penicillium brasilianum]|uniref:Arginine rich protein n=1 Tax=Penicillium brasilianum TaxID=104259 RepID=A0A1S9RAQ9_PENBI|nr:Arginine rich protein [Penicillium brasilianum]